MQRSLTTPPRALQGLTVALVLLLLAGAYGAYRFYTLSGAYRAMKTDLENTITRLEADLAALTQENVELSEALYSEQQKNASFEEQIEEIADTVGVLDKLSKTDPELLQKYSKVYFLNEHYVPSRLRDIDEAYLLDKTRELQIHAQVWPELEDLLQEAQEDGIQLRIVSAYRSFGTQAALKSGYMVTYGAGANRFSADQGYSEHQLGTTLDFTTPELGSSFTNFQVTPAYAWLQENAHRFGFVLSYPENNAYYQFEPWHWRYVGDDLARDLHREDKFFYDLDQREIDSYLVEIF